MTPFTKEVIRIIQSIPLGNTMSYGEVAAAAGNHRGARQVSRILHSCTQKHNLPWYRVVGKGRRITIPDKAGAELQQQLLAAEGVYL